MSGRAFFGFIVTRIDGDTNACAQTAVRAFLAQMRSRVVTEGRGWFPERAVGALVEDDAFVLAWSLLGERAMLRVRCDGASFADAFTLHHNLDLAGLGPRLARALGVDVWSFVEDHQHEWWERAERWSADGVSRERYDDDVYTVLQRVGLTLEDDAWPKAVAPHLAAAKLTVQLGLTMAALRELATTIDVEQRLVAPPIPRLLEDAASRPPPRPAPTDKVEVKLALPRELLDAVQREANRTDRSLSFIVVRAWEGGKDAVRAAPFVDALPALGVDAHSPSRTQTIYMTGAVYNAIVDEAARLGCDVSRVVAAGWMAGTAAIAALPTIN